MQARGIFHLSDTGMAIQVHKAMGASLLFGVGGFHDFYRKPEAPSAFFFVGSSFGNMGNAQDYPHLVHLQIKSEAETEHIIVSFS